MSLTMLMAAAALAASELTIPGPRGPLAGTLLDPGRNAPAVILIPGSGPTNRDGDNPAGVAGSVYRQLAEQLAARGIATLRIDKRGMFGSKAAIPDANAVTIADYSTDVRNWVAVARKHTGTRCAWLLGHSEGGLVALAAAQDRKDICGVILVAAPGRKLGEILRDQLRANPANAPVLDDALGAITALEAARKVDVSAFHPALRQLFAPQVQGFLLDAMAKDPAALASALKVPLLIVGGDRDVQVPAAEARALAAAQPKAKLVVLPGMTHALKLSKSDSRADIMATYMDASEPVAAGLVDAIAAFVRR